MSRVRLTLEYDGTDFRGWQVQDSGRSVQAVVEESLAKVTQESPRLTAAGRTDAGVHARGQVAHLDTQSRLSPLELRSALNAVLPGDVAVREAVPVGPGFHARYDALWKRYRYRVLNRAAPSPLRGRYTWHLRGRLDLAAMSAAAGALLGEHDFAAYRGAPGGSPPHQSTIRHLSRLEVKGEDDEVWVIAEGKSFLRYMVRNLVGTLVEVGRGRRPHTDPAALFESGDRSRSGPTAPARGLCLERVVYPQIRPESLEH